MSPLRSRPVSAVVLALVAVFALGACGGGGDATKTTKTVEDGKITIDAFDVHFDVDDIKTEAGALEITLVNKGVQQHTLKIPDKDFELKVESKGETDSGTVTLEPGTYEYECTIPGHAAQGMKGEIQVS